uniref:Uncharacterized protein n=1 Tax=Myripristis murdjan TaxID=586833 RepID=A0A667ZM57_9TELE
MKFISYEAVRFSALPGEVTTFANCTNFFFNGISPTTFPNNNHYKEICQCLPNQPVYYYATLYDTANRIPVYSAYQFHHGNNRRQTTWYIEPQGITHQATNDDYKKSGYDKGHLYPVRHTSTPDQMEATFTLTNAAPQNLTFNRGNWSQHEDQLVDILKKCRSAFVVTGVVPGARTINNRVRVAAYYWSAYCCNNGMTLRSGGFIGPKKGKVESMTVKNLEAMLKSVNQLKPKTPNFDSKQ